MADVAAPPYRIIPIIPALKPGAMEGLAPFVASDKINEAIGFPGQLVDDWEVPPSLRDPDRAGVALLRLHLAGSFAQAGRSRLVLSHRSHDAWSCCRSR